MLVSFFLSFFFSGQRGWFLLILIFKKLSVLDKSLTVASLLGPTMFVPAKAVKKNGEGVAYLLRSDNSAKTLHQCLGRVMEKFLDWQGHGAPLGSHISIFFFLRFWRPNPES